jgi:hypothetical protein
MVYQRQWRRRSNQAGRRFGPDYPRQSPSRWIGEPDCGPTRRDGDDTAQSRQALAVAVVAPGNDRAVDLSAGRYSPASTATSLNRPALVMPYHRPHATTVPLDFSAKLS